MFRDKSMHMGGQKNYSYIELQFVIKWFKLKILLYFHKSILKEYSNLEMMFFMRTKSGQIPHMRQKHWSVPIFELCMCV